MLMVQGIEDTLSKMQAGSRRSHRPFKMRIDRLVTAFVYILCLPVKIWRNRNLTAFLQNL